MTNHHKPLNKKASLLNFSSVVILRDYDWSFVRTSAVSAAEWSRMATLRLIGPTERWCFRWSNKTRTCGLVDVSEMCWHGMLTTVNMNILYILCVIWLLQYVTVMCMYIYILYSIYNGILGFWMMLMGLNGMYCEFIHGIQWSNGF